MPKLDEAAETLSKCPRCQRQSHKSPDERCPLCKGSGLVSGKMAVVWDQFEAAAASSSSE